MADPTGPRSGRIGGPRPEPAASDPVEEPRTPPEPEPEVASASRPASEEAAGANAARGMDALFEQLGEAAPAVLEHVVNAARELMRAAKAVVDAAEGAMDVARSGVDDEHSDPKPSAGENRTPPPGSPGPKASPGPPGIQRIDVD